MQFAYPPRKNSDATSFKPRGRTIPIPPILRRSRTKLFLFIFAVVGTILFLILRPSNKRYRSAPSHVPSGKPPAVIVTVFDETNYKKPYLDMVRQNRFDYAKKHGYKVFTPKIGDYDLKGSPFSWTKIVALRDALTQFPDASYFWYLEQDTFIMNPESTVEGDVMSAKRIEQLMIKEHPVVPPDSIIKTFSHLKGKDVDFVLSQDKEGLSIGSFFLRNTDFAKFLMETWFDPLYRSYNFQKAEAHALEHIVQWHPTILSKLSLVPQRTFNSFTTGEADAKYQPGDMALKIGECSKTDSSACMSEATRWSEKWKAAFDS